MYVKKFLLAVACAAGLAGWVHGQEIRGDSDALRLVFDGPLVDLTLGPCDPVPAPLSAKAAGGCADPALSKDLVLYYPFDEDLGKIVRDASGNGRTGWVQGATWIQDGARGGAVRFDGNKQTITATDAGLPSGNSPRTMAIWIKLDKLYPDGTTGLFSYGTWQWNQACGLGMDWRNDRDQFYFTQNGGVALSRAKMDQAGIWRHLAYVYDGMGQHRLYVDGVPSEGMSELRGPLHTTLSGLLMLAGHPGSIGPDGGCLDEAMIFNRALSPAEVGAVYRGALPVEIVETAAGDCPRVITRIWMTKDALGGIRPPEPIPVEFAETSAGDCPRVITRVWTAKDRCGHEASARQTITIADRTPPVLLGVPADLELACGDEIPPPDAVRALDENCAPAGGVPGMVLHYPFDRRAGRATQGEVVIDASGNGNHGQRLGALIEPGGMPGLAIRFDGVDDYVRVPSSPTLMPKAITVAAWVQPLALPENVSVLVHKRNESLHDNEDYVLHLTAAGTVRFVLANGGWQTRLDTPVLELGTWHHVAATFAQPEMRIYVDGKLVGTARHDFPLAHNSKADLFLGASDHLVNPLASFAHCRLDDVRIYPRALKPEDVAQFLGHPLPVEMAETRLGECPETLARTWTATDRCGNVARATQLIARAASAPILVGVPENAELACGASVPPPPLVTAIDPCGGDAGSGRYEIIAGAYTWAQAKADAEARGGHLATITSDEEWAVIQRVAGVNLNGQELWLGGTDAEREGVWAWITGEPWGYVRWAPGEPNNNANEDFLTVNHPPRYQGPPDHPGLWNDFRDIPAEPLGYLLEREGLRVDFVEVREGGGAGCGILERTWTATDACGNATSATQTIVLAASGRPATRHVRQDSPAPGYPFDTWENAAHTIQEAVDAALPGDTVLVAKGVYASGARVTPGHLLLNRVVITNDIAVRSVSGPAATIIRGQGPRGPDAVRGVYMTAGHLIGFTVENGHTRLDGDGSYDRNGGGVNAYPATQPVISNCVIRGNAAHDSAGSTWGTLYNCVIRNNSAERASGGSAAATLYNCLIADNAAGYYGGGADQATLINCTVVGNRAANGGGVYNCRLYNCVVYSNAPANVAVATCRTTCTTPLQSGEGNLADDPLLTADGHVAADSPCVGKGSAAYAIGTDIDGDAWANPPAMGCDEPAAEPIPGLDLRPGLPGVIAFSSSPDRLYTLQSCTDLTSGEWVDVPGKTRIPGSGDVFSLAEPEGRGTSYYRIVVEEP